MTWRPLSGGPEPGTGGRENRGSSSPHEAPVRQIETSTWFGSQDVLVLDEGNGARQIVGSTDAPVRSVIVGIVDAVTAA